MKLIVNSYQSLQDAIGELRQQYGARKYVSVQITADRMRRKYAKARKVLGVE